MRQTYRNYFQLLLEYHSDTTLTATRIQNQKLEMVLKPNDLEHYEVDLLLLVFVGRTEDLQLMKKLLLILYFPSESEYLLEY